MMYAEARLLSTSSANGLAGNFSTNARDSREVFVLQLQAARGRDEMKIRLVRERTRQMRPERIAAFAITAERDRPPPQS